MKPATAKAATATGFESILFATDFSDAANRAIPFVKAIAKRYEAKVVALHVHPPVVNPMTPPETWAAESAARAARDRTRREELLRTFAGFPIEVFIEEGGIQEELENAMKAHHTDLVVMGTRGRTGVGKLLLGSTAEEILRNVKCPVLTVGPYAELSRVADGKVREILYATDFAKASPKAAEYAVSLAQEFEARLVLLHVVNRQSANDLVMTSDVVKSAKALLERVVPAEALNWCKPEYFVEEGTPAEKILEMAHLRESGLIVLGAKAEEGVPGASTHLPIATVHKIISHAECPVLTVRG
ncbi:MAG TPA: universal stress protein [Candidatus Acidoferrum sp.]|nr:universal stress protein [Candidatus Acidoferrum sp.]